ncbi:MAG TPA: glycosyltransferase, partial [Bacteroidia bacterium]|nr:glycosyltransferase [Bacteroidia bacterium]
PRLKYMLTVNDSIAKLYHNEYGTDVKVMRNLPMKSELHNRKTRKDLNLPEDKNIVLLQGAGINIDRGAEEAVQSMQQVNNAILLIIGGGDAIENLKALTQKWNLAEKVKFIPKLPFEKLIQYTAQADIGLTLDKNTNLNYLNSLPNKLFDYIHAGVPVLASALPEVKRIVEKYNIGECIESVTPEEIAKKISEILANKEKLSTYKVNTTKAKEALCWEKEKKVLEELLITRSA